ncbi:alpha/beta fold hydrolase [Ketobacter sp. MCCC 1A13808]|uniref:alpha/beta fold hydrolase n=1 Tax=Ketobacter sp. MCCC 1A13808 TaxID=2602738 RepID=UPI0012EC96A0|nr:alpha/beta fold hydrolase [Ketobacter sp. MCCC 1A13808]MVF12717.1 alpha/beta fold hydrolase [Ketobacter sp. MCCC 1A13808]
MMPLKPAQLKATLKNVSERLLRPGNLITGGKTPSDIVYENELIKVLHYRPDRAAIARNSRYAVPLVIVPPLAINNLIYDWFPDRSFVRFMLAQGFDVYLVDWGSPTRKHAHYTLNTYVSHLLPLCLQHVRQHSGRRELTLHGWSMGGGLALCYQALSQDKLIRNIITIGTAVDGHANGQIGRQYAVINRGLKKIGFNLSKVPARWVYAPAWANVIGFKLSDPVSSVQGYVDLIRNLDDREFMARHANQSAFMDNLEAYPGGVIRDWMYSIWLENEAARGYITLDNTRAYFKDVDANLLCIAGSNDKLANQHCCKPLMNMVGSEDKQYLLCEGGHTGIVSGKRAPEQIWPQISAWLASRSKPYAG